MTSEINNPKGYTPKDKYKSYQVDYLRVFEEETDASGKIISNRPFDLSDILRACEMTPVERRTIRHREEVIRLQDIAKLDALSNNLSECKNVWKLNFIRIDPNQIDPIATSDGGYHETLLGEKLEDNQFIAHPTACLYDEDKNLFIIARNRDAVLPSAIIEYFRRVSDIKRLTFAIITYDASGRLNDYSVYRRLIIGISDVKNMSRKDKKYFRENIPSVYKALKGFEGYGYCNLKIELSMSPSPRKDSLDVFETSNTALQMMEADIKNIKTLKVASKENSDSSVELVDLINNKVKDSFKMPCSRQNPVLYKDLIFELLNSYNKKYQELELLLE